MDTPTPFPSEKELLRDLCNYYRGLLQSLQAQVDAPSIAEIGSTLRNREACSAAAGVALLTQQNENLKQELESKSSRLRQLEFDEGSRSVLRELYFSLRQSHGCLEMDGTAWPPQYRCELRDALRIISASPKA